MTTLRLPGLVDAHVHLREPGYTHKEDFTTGTAAALAGGVTTVLDMPNTDPPTSTPERLAAKAALAADKIVCDVGLFVGATVSEQDAYLPVAERACGLKIYVGETFGSLRIEDLGLLERLFRTWAERGNEGETRPRAKGKRQKRRGPFDAPRTATPPALRVTHFSLGPIAVHAEDLMLPVCLYLSDLYAVPLHVVHVSRRREIELIRRAKEYGTPVTCEATPHHLFLSRDDRPRLGARGDMRPRLGTLDDVAALWEHLDVIDVFATDHAPHTRAEKGLFPDKETGRQGEGEMNHPITPSPHHPIPLSPRHPITRSSPPPGVPGVETMLPLLLTAVHAGRLTLDDIIARCVENPRRIYGLPEQPDTWVEVDVDASYVLEDEAMHTKAGWTPFAGMTVCGRVERVTLRGETVFDGERVLARPGSGRVVDFSWASEHTRSQ